MRPESTRECCCINVLTGIENNKIIFPHLLQIIVLCSYAINRLSIFIVEYTF